MAFAHCIVAREDSLGLLIGPRWDLEQMTFRGSRKRIRKITVRDNTSRGFTFWAVAIVIAFTAALAWLMNHPTMGSIIRDWNERRVIQPRVKVIATVTVLVLVSLPLVFGSFHPALKGVSLLVGLTVIVMIYRQAG